MERNSNIGLEPVKRRAGWIIFGGILLIILGLLAIAGTMTTTILSVLFLGTLLIIGGVVDIIDTFVSWWGLWKGFILHLLVGILFLALGVFLVRSPLLASISLTLWIGIFYIVLGVFRIFYSLSSNLSQWGWILFSGIIALLLGILILANWPTSGLYIIGLFVGIDLLFWGLAYMMIGISLKS